MRMKWKHFWLFFLLISYQPNERWTLTKLSFISHQFITQTHTHTLPLINFISTFFLFHFTVKGCCWAELVSWVEWNGFVCLHSLLLQLHFQLSHSIAYACIFFFSVHYYFGLYVDFRRLGAVWWHNWLNVLIIVHNLITLVTLEVLKFSDFVEFWSVFVVVGHTQNKWKSWLDWFVFSLDFSQTSNQGALSLLFSVIDEQRIVLDYYKSYVILFFFSPPPPIHPPLYLSLSRLAAKRADSHNIICTCLLCLQIISRKTEQIHGKGARQQSKNPKQYYIELVCASLNMALTVIARACVWHDRGNNTNFWGKKSKKEREKENERDKQRERARETWENVRSRRTNSTIGLKGNDEKEKKKKKKAKKDKRQSNKRSLWLTVSQKAHT